MTVGVIYVATGDTYYHESLKSIIYTRKNLPKAYVILYTDKIREKDYLFDEVKILEKPTWSFSDKIKVLIDPPFNKNLFIDTDTFVIRDASEGFNILDKNDIAVARSTIPNVYTLNDIPSWFKEMNTGVIFFRNNKEVIKFAKKWLNLYEELGAETSPPPHDQPSFRMALYNSEVKYFILGSEYNLRTPFPALRDGNIKTIIIHDRWAGEEINNFIELEEKIDLEESRKHKTSRPILIFKERGMQGEICMFSSKLIDTRPKLYFLNKIKFILVSRRLKRHIKKFIVGFY